MAKARDWRVRFASKFNRGNSDECWDWKGYISERGYGAFRMNPYGWVESSNRASYIFHCGEIPAEMHVLHSCDNKKCVNPAHLRVGTSAENSREASERGLYVTGNQWRAAHLPTIPRGEAHKNARLTERQVLAIRNSDSSGVLLSKQYGVSPKTISRVRRREVWSHIGA